MKEKKDHVSLVRNSHFVLICYCDMLSLISVAKLFMEEDLLICHITHTHILYKRLITIYSLI